MVPNDHENNYDDLTLESILDEYRGFDPEAPEATPVPEASFATKVAEAELIDAGPDELLTPETLVALQDETDEAQAQIDLTVNENELFSQEEELTPESLESVLSSLHENDLDEILAEIHKQEAAAGNNAPAVSVETLSDDDVREYYPHGTEPVQEYEEELEEELYPDSGPFAKLKGFAQKFAEIIAPEEDAYPEETEPELPDPVQTIPPEAPTQVFQAVAETFGEDVTADLPVDEEVLAQLLQEEEVYADADAVPAEDSKEAFFSGQAPEPDIPAPDDEPEDYDDEEYEEVERRSFEEAVIRPLVSRIAAVSWRLKERREEKREEASLEEDLGPEMPPRHASRHYSSQESALRTRSRFALIMSLVLLYLSSGLPVLGLLRNSPRVMALMCVLLELTVMLIGVDVLTVGLTSFRNKRVGIESLVLLGCVFSLIDGVLCAVFNSLQNGLPYCVVSAFAVTFLIYSSFCRARGYGLTFHVLSRSKDPGILTAGTNEFYDGITLTKTRRSSDGFIHRAEEPGPDAVVFALLTPYLIAAACILSLLATLLSGSVKNAGHVFAAIFTAAAPLAAIIAYTVPFKSLASFLQPQGLAVAGWSGASDIGRSKRFVVKDRDLFGPNSISVGQPVFLQGMSEAKIVAYAASLVNASGCCLNPAFLELLSGYNYPLFRVERFRCDSAGGMSGFINDEEVLFGTSEFMRLKEINTSQPDVEDHTSLFVAINHELCGMFPVRYHAMRSVKNALNYLLKSSERPVFAARDPNIAPSMLKKKFRMQTDGFDFPPFRQRYVLSDPEAGVDDPICGVVTRSGLAPLLTITKTGKQLCRYVHAGLAASLILMIIGVLAMFWLCSVGLFATGSAFHLALYELISALVIPLVCYFVKR